MEHQSSICATSRDDQVAAACVLDRVQLLCPTVWLGLSELLRPAGALAIAGSDIDAFLVVRWSESSKIAGGRAALMEWELSNVRPTAGFPMTRRTALLALASLSTVTTCGKLHADALPRYHAVSLVGTPRHAPDFSHFDWVNPNAPKGGSVRMWSLGSFDSLNPFATKGIPAEGLSRARGAGLVFESLMAASADEPATDYGLIAEWLTFPPDYSSVTYKLREEARFHDGEPIKPEDVIYSLNVLKTGHPQFTLYYKNVVKAEVVGHRLVKFHFDITGNRELPLIVGDMPILPRHFWQARSAAGETRDPQRASMEPPLGSGPYRIKDFVAGRSIVYERVKDWWGAHLPVNKGQWNFDEIRYVYFQDRLPAFEQFKAGHLDFWRERSAKGWAMDYEFDAVRRKEVVKHALPIKTIAHMQGFVLNQRRKAFQDVRVRRAFNLAFDFEWSNANVAFGQYERVGSYFENSELKSSGLPQGRELELLEAVREHLPPEVFTKEYRNPVNQTADDVRRHMSEAARLLADAGWKLGPARGERVLQNAAGEPLTVEFLIVQRDFERLIMPYIKRLELLGIKASVRLVDAPQYVRRMDSFDFDIIIRSFPQSLSPGNEQREFWGSAAADRDGSRNVMGLKNPGIDALIDNVIFARDRSNLVIATRALDRALLWGAYVVPLWHSPTDRLAMWNMFAHPARLPSQDPSFLRIWWLDEAAHSRLMQARGR